MDMSSNSNNSPSPSKTRTKEERLSRIHNTILIKLINVHTNLLQLQQQDINELNVILFTILSEAKCLYDILQDIIKSNNIKPLGLKETHEEQFILIKPRQIASEIVKIREIVRNHWNFLDVLTIKEQVKLMYQTIDDFREKPPKDELPEDVDKMTWDSFFYNEKLYCTKKKRKKRKSYEGEEKKAIRFQ